MKYVICNSQKKTEVMKALTLFLIISTWAGNQVYILYLFHLDIYVKI